MKRPQLLPYYFFFLLLVLFSRLEQVNAAQLGHIKTNDLQLTPVLQPTPPHLAAKAYMMIDVHSGKILAEKNSQQRRPPASLTKAMTLYVVSNALKTGQIQLNDKVRISKKAWKTPGSRMFIKEGQYVTVENLLKGVIVHSGNDACVALAEHIAGNEKTFADIMNQQAKALGMKQSHFTDSTGLPNPNHYSTAHDLAILGRALINDFPQYYHWYKQKWFTFNGIRQPNRNRLLWRNLYVDGLKTGHTKEAGYCLISSAKKDDMRLLSVVLGAPSDSARAEGSQRLLTFGFRFYETHELYKQNTKITRVRIWKGEKSTVPAGITHPIYVTIPAGQYKQLQVAMELPNVIEAPIKKGERLGGLVIRLNNEIINQQDLIAMDTSLQGGFMTRIHDSLRMSFHQWFSKKST